MSLKKSLSIYFSSSLLEERLMDIDDPLKYILPVLDGHQADSNNKSATVVFGPNKKTNNIFDSELVTRMVFRQLENLPTC